MRKQLLKMAMIIMSITFIFGCAGPKVPLTFQLGQIPAHQYNPQVDNFMILLDSSSSMGRKYSGHEKLSIARSVVKSMNLTLPELDFTSGMITFGHCPSVTDQPSLLVYGMTKYSSSDLGSAVDGVTCAGGTTPLGSAIREAHKTLKTLDGKTALIIVSDGEDLLHDPKSALEEMVNELGDGLCAYTIQVGDNPVGSKNLEQLVSVAACGFATTADYLGSADNMVTFVEDVFLSSAPITVAKPVEEPLVDIDADEVIGKIHFDFDKAIIRPDAKPVLQEITSFMTQNPTLKMNINGFTDNIGTMEYNQKLSEKRAKAAKNYLINQGIDSNRFATKGFSYTRPIASNTTAEGRAMNRRVEFVPLE